MPDPVASPAVGEPDDDECRVLRGRNKPRCGRLNEKRLRVHAKRPVDSEGCAGEEAAGVAALGAEGGAGQYERQFGPEREPGAELDR